MHFHSSVQYALDLCGEASIQDDAMHMVHARTTSFLGHARECFEDVGCPIYARNQPSAAVTISM